MTAGDERARADFPARITDRVETPCYLISEEVIARNCAVLDSVQQRTGAKILLALKAFVLPFTYRLGGISCLAGDVIGDYSFAEPLQPGDRLVLLDMALYSFVKNTTFNGVELPALITFNRASDTVNVVRRFGYEDYKSRLS